MIKFTVEAANFIKAGEVEKLLKDAGIRYDTQLVNGHAKKAARTRSNLTAADVKNVLSYLATHYSESNREVAKHFDCGENTIWRIRNGTHPLCKKV